MVNSSTIGHRVGPSLPEVVVVLMVVELVTGVLVVVVLVLVETGSVYVTTTVSVVVEIKVKVSVLVEVTHFVVSVHVLVHSGI